MAGAGAAGAAWVVPTVLTAPAVAAASNLATVVAGTVIHAQGNAATFATKDMPVGTFTTLVLVVGIVADSGGTTGPTAAQPITVGTAGWTQVSSITDGNAPGFGVFTAAGGAAPPIVNSQNLQSGRLTAAVLGWSNGTTVTASIIASATAPTTALTVGSTSSPSPATWVFAGSASEGVAANNWAPLGAPDWSAVIPDVSGNNNTPPDMYIVRRTSLLATIPSLSETFFQSGSSGNNYGARGVFIGVS